MEATLGLPPPKGPQTPLTILSLNLGGTNAESTSLAVDLITRHRADVSVYCETKFHTSRAAADFAATMRGKLHYRDAPRTLTQGPARRRVAQNGGVAIVVHDRTIRAVRVAEDERGLLALSLRREGAQPFLIIAIYLAPTTSRNKGWRRPLLKRAADILRRESPRHGAYAVAGDFNSQIGAWKGRVTEAGAPIHHRDLIEVLLTPFNMAPASGRVTRAALTSPRVGAGDGVRAAPAREVDYILCHAAARVTALPTMEKPPTQSHHRPIGAVFQITASESDEPQRPPPRQITRPPPFRSEFWTESFGTMSLALGNVERAADMGAPPDELYYMLNDMFALTQQHPAVRTTPLVFIRREYRGVAIPRDAASLLAEVRTLRKRQRDSNDDDERKAIAADATARRDRALTIVRAARATGLATFTAALEDARKNDSRGLFRSIRTAAAGSNASHDRPPEAEEAFIKHYRELLTKPDTCPPLFTAMYPSLPGDAPTEWSKYSWQEIYLVLFPYSRNVFESFLADGGRTPQCAVNCKVCAAFCAHGEAHAVDPSQVHAPSWMPRIRLNRATGQDSVPAEMLRHFRSPHSDEDTAAYRERVARTIATLFDEIVDDGPPQGAVDVIVSALAKAAKSGLRPDPSLPDKTRGISLHNTLAKLHDIIIDVRFIHAIVTNTIVSSTQAGFMPGRSTEQCAFSLFETVRARWREGLDTWVLFVDFWKAYDNVSPSAMWRILERIGFPQRIISYLRSCYEQRKTRFSYNGSVVDSFEQLLGLCQGGVLSCLFFNLFIESLSRYLEATDKLRGVKVTTPGGTVTVLSKFFADDLKALAATRGQLAQLAEAIVKWCAAHGLKVTVSGTDKTAAMHFAVNTPAVLPTDLVIKVGSTELRIPFTRLYIYVGHRVTDSLNPSRCRMTLSPKCAPASRHVRPTPSSEQQASHSSDRSS